jgi:hypothetical protein
MNRWVRRVIKERSRRAHLFSYICKEARFIYKPDITSFGNKTRLESKGYMYVISACICNDYKDKEWVRVTKVGKQGSVYVYGC